MKSFIDHLTEDTGNDHPTMEWKRDPAPAGLPNAHVILASIMKKLVG